MKRLLSIALLVPAFSLFCGLAVGQEGEERPSKKATPEDYKRLATVSAPQYVGKVSVGPKSVTFRVDDAEYRKQLKQAASLPKPAEQKTAMAAVERKFAQFKWALGKEFELELSDKVALRKTKVEFEYDEKGNPKKMPFAGTDKLYTAKVEDFGDHVTTVILGAMKNGKPTVVRLVVDNSK